MDPREAAQFGEVERLRQLLDTGAITPDWVDQDECSLLHWAAINNRLLIADLVISRGCNVNSIGGVLRSTPLHWAARQGHLKMVAFLVRRGADVGKRDVEGFTALHIAVQFGKTPVVAYLIAGGQSVDTPDVSFMTPAMWTVTKVFSADPLTLLLALGADMSKKDSIYHNTPLHWAACHGNYVAVKIILRDAPDIDLNCLNKENETALDVARRRGDFATARLIEIECRRKNILASNTRQLLTERPMNARRFLTLLPFLTYLFLAIILHTALLSSIKFLLFSAYLTMTYYVCRKFRSNDFNTAVPVAFAFATKVVLILTWVAYLHATSTWYMQIAFTILLFYLPFIFVRVCTLDPGVIRTSYQEKCKTIVQISEVGEGQLKFCHTCLLLRPKRGKHCSDCNLCYRRFDHHCPWLNTCVAGNNHRAFVYYLIALLVSTTTFECGVYMYMRDVCGSFEVSDAFECNEWLAFTALLTVPCFLFPLFLLLQQLWQIAHNVTTNERLNMARYTEFSIGSHPLDIRSPYSNGVLRNLYEFFCGQTADSMC